MKILLIDDHALVREGLKLVLADHFPHSTFGEAHSAQEALECVSKRKWDLALLDIALPGRGGLEVLREIKRSHPRLPVLVLSMNPEDQFAVRMLKSGAAGYLTKSSVGDELIQAIRKIMAGGRYVSSRLAGQMTSYLDLDVKKAPHERLSEHEFLMVRLIASGKSVGQIANDLSLSISTISTYRRRILEKMGMENNAQLTRYAIQNKLVIHLNRPN